MRIVNVRLEGSQEDCEAMIEQIEKLGSVRTNGRFYPNRGRGDSGRMYVEVCFDEKELTIEGDAQNGGIQ